MAISLLDVKRGSYKPKRIDEEQDRILGQQLANNIISTVNNTAKKTSNALTVKQSKVNTELPKQQTQEEILSDLKNNNTNQINEEGYTDTGKKFGDYYYHDYKTKGQYKIYSKNNHYYYYDKKKQSYIPFTGRESWMTTKEDDEKAYQEAVKAGYKDNSIKDKSGNYLSMENQLKLDTTDLTKEERKQYTEDLFRQQKNKEEENAVQYGGPGLKGSISELQRMGKNIQENLIEPIGRSAENYQYGELNRQLGIEAYKEMMGEKNDLKSVQDKLSKYQKFNEDIISSQNLIDQNTQNLPNQVSGMVEGIKGAGVLGTLGAIGGGVAGAVATKTPQGALVGAEKGAKLLGGAGYTGAQAKSTYELEAGYAYQTMIEMGVPKEIAKEEAQKVGTTNAVIESGETLLDMITMGKASQITGKISEGLAKKYGLETVRNWAKKGVGSYLTNIASEGAEEALQEYSSIQGEKRATKKAGIQRDDSDDLERIKSSAIAGAFGGMVSGAVTRPAGIITNRATNNIINNVADKVSKNQSISTLTQSPVVSNQNNLKNVAQTSIANTVNSFNLGKNVQTVKTNQTFKQSAKNYHIDVNNETINSIDKTLSQRGIKARFDSNAFINSNENAFWQLNKDGSREVVFNPNAKTNDLLENVAVHELYHDIFKSKDGQNIKDELLDFAKTKEGYNEARKSLEQLYSNKYDPNSDEFNAFIDEEAVASILGKKLGNQEFVNSLTVEKPSVAKSVYNWVVDKLNKLNKLTGYKSEKLFWKDIKNKFDSAYRSENVNFDAKIRFMITGRRAAKQLDKTFNTKEFSKNYKEAIKMEKQGISKGKIRKETGWYKDINGDWKFEISDKSAKLKISPKLSTNYKLEELLDHNILYKAYPYLKNTNVKFSKLSETTRGKTDNLTGNIYINNNLIGNNSQIEKTLLHEVQHKLQKKEKFQGGTTQYRENSYDRYRHNFGETEARETSQRKNLNFEERLATPSYTQIYNKQSKKKLYTKEDTKWYNYLKGDRDAEENLESSKKAIRPHQMGGIEELDNSLKV